MLHFGADVGRRAVLPERSRAYRAPERQPVAEALFERQRVHAIGLHRVDDERHRCYFAVVCLGKTGFSRGMATDLQRGQTAQAHQLQQRVQVGGRGPVDAALLHQRRGFLLHQFRQLALDLDATPDAQEVEQDRIVGLAEPIADLFYPITGFVASVFGDSHEFQIWRGPADGIMPKVAI